MNEYSEAAVEVLDILDHTEQQALNKIPKSFIKFLVNIASTDYIVNLDHSKTIGEMNVNEKTKEILGAIYINWWCDAQEKEQYKKKIAELEKQHQQEVREKYNPDNIFRKQNQTAKNTTTTELIPIKSKENLLTKIFSKIISFFLK